MHSILKIHFYLISREHDIGGFMQFSCNWGCESYDRIFCCQREQKCEFSVCSGIVTGARSACRSFAPVYIWEKNVHCQKTQWVNNETGKNSSKYSIQIRFSYLNRCLCQQKPKWNLSISCLMQDCQSLKLQVLCLQNGSHR